jgi:trehalose-phosphatase
MRRPIVPERNQKLNLLVEQLHRGHDAIPGLWIENKEWTRCVHYRETKTTDRARVRAFLRRTFLLAKRLGLPTLSGQKTLEVFPDSRWNKGYAVRWLMKKRGLSRVFYIGDDETDESVFRLLARPHVTVRIGRRRRSKAAYFVSHQRDVVTLLKRILA